MSTEVKDDGGPAFGEFKQAGHVSIKVGGLSVRDYFAAKAMQAAYARAMELGMALEKSVIATSSFEMADAMLQVRNNGSLSPEPASQHLLVAAPDLLEAAMVCLKAEKERRKKLLPGAPATTYCEKRIALIEAAIYKATGKRP